MAEQKELDRVNSTFRGESKSSDRKHSVPYWVYVAIGTFLYAGIWSYIGILKILSLNAYVFDLGINSERGWQILHTNLGLHGYLTTLINSGIVFPLSPLTGSGNFFAMVIFQAFSIAIVGPALYSIAKLKGLTTQNSMLLSLAYFLYFPIYGAMWFDFHYQVFFIPLFIYGYLFYLRKNYATSTLIFFLSGIVRYPYSIFPMIFAFFELIIIFHDHNTRYEKKRLMSVALLFGIMLSWTILGLLNNGISHTIPHSYVSIYMINNVTLFSRVFVIFLFLAPLLFLPVVKPRWIILTLPAFYLFFTSYYTWYTYPYVFQGQYVTGVVPFVFLGILDYTVVNGNDCRKKPTRIRFRIKNSKSLKLIFPTIIILLIFFNIFMAPFSPLNNSFGDKFNFPENTSYNLSRYNELKFMVAIIPQSNPYVLYQNNIPEVLPRNLPFNNTILMSGYLGGLTGYSISDAINNSWPVQYGNGQKGFVQIDYVIADFNNPNFYLQNNSMFNLINLMYSSGKYGIVSEGYGLILLERNYSGPIINYVQ